MLCTGPLIIKRGIHGESYQTGNNMKGIYELEMAKEPEGDNILIVDSLNLAFRYKHTNKRNFAEEYVRTIESLARSYSCSTVIITCDSGKSEYRKTIYPEYKADRELKRANQTEEEAESFKLFFEDFEEAIELCKQKYPVLKYKGVEADDIAAYLTHTYFKDSPNDIWLISSDKDWDLLITEKVSRFSFVTRKEYTLDNWSERFEYPIDAALDNKVLIGGKDNVAGIPGIGEKRAKDIIEEYGSVFDLLQQLPIPGTAKYIKNLNELGAERIPLNLMLIDKLTYNVDAIGKDNIKDINEILS